MEEIKVWTGRQPDMYLVNSYIVNSYIVNSYIINSYTVNSCLLWPKCRMLRHFKFFMQQLQTRLDQKMIKYRQNLQEKPAVYDIKN